MGRTRFDVRFTPRAPQADGADEVEFILSPNPGEPMKPLSAIASGGEISRIMLAMKAISAENEGVDTMIFDEIDTGVSGRMAQTVGEKMCALGRSRQVICVTHLAQIAALGDSQYLVEKTVKDGHTGSSVRRLDEEGRVGELARLVGGADDSASRARACAQPACRGRDLEKEAVLNGCLWNLAGNAVKDGRVGSFEEAVLNAHPSRIYSIDECGEG